MTGTRKAYLSKKRDSAKRCWLTKRNMGIFLKKADRGKTKEVLGTTTGEGEREGKTLRFAAILRLGAEDLMGEKIPPFTNIPDWNFQVKNNISTWQ